MRKFWEWLKGLFSRFRVRAGLDKFLERYLALAVKVIIQLAAVNSGVSFHQWKDQARQQVIDRLKADGQEIRDNWIELLLGLAFENQKGQ